MPTVLTLIGITLFLSWIGWTLWRIFSGRAALDVEGFIGSQIKYQTCFFLVAAVLSGLVYYHSPQSSVFALGSLTAPVASGWVIGDGWSWVELGLCSLLLFSIATIFLCAASFRGISNWSSFLRKYVLLIVLFAAINALSEELIYRGMLVSTVQQQLSPFTTAILSAILFALAHVRGQARGVTVIAGSAVVGFVLGLSAVQTGDLFWAWCIHFAQDVIIFAAFIASFTQAKQAF